MARGIIKPNDAEYISINDDDVKKENYNNDGAKTNGSIAIGPDALSEMTWTKPDGSSDSVDGGIAIGSGATNNVTYTFDGSRGLDYLNSPSTVVGTNASATGPVGGSVVIGTRSSSTIFAGTAIGFNATVTGAEGDQNFGDDGVQGGGIAIGTYSTSSYDGSSRPSQTLTPIAIGTVASATADGAIAIGEEASSSALKGYALGAGAKVTAESAVTYGPYTVGSIPYGVALGAESKTTVDKNIAGYDPSTSQDSTDTSATWRSTLGAISVGDGSSKTRQINSVAAGTKDTDAVNVAQLKAINDNEFFFTINRAGRAYLYTNSRWISQADDNYGTQYVNFSENAGTGNDPIVEWEVLGEPIRKGTKVHELAVTGRVNSATDVQDMILVAYFVYPTNADALTTTGIGSDNEVSYTEIGRMMYREGGSNDETITGQLSRLYRRNMDINFVAPQDGELRLYYKPIASDSGISVTRYYRHSLSWLLSYNR